jgi:hypothetical protein
MGGPSECSASSQRCGGVGPNGRAGTMWAARPSAAPRASVDFALQGECSAGPVARPEDHRRPGVGRCRAASQPRRVVSKGHDALVVAAPTPASALTADATPPRTQVGELVNKLATGAPAPVARSRCVGCRPARALDDAVNARAAVTGGHAPTGPASRGGAWPSAWALSPSTTSSSATCEFRAAALRSVLPAHGWLPRTGLAMTR